MPPTSKATSMGGSQKNDPCGIGASTSLMRVTRTSIITFIWPAPDESKIWFVATETLALPFETCIRVPCFAIYISTECETHFNSHFITSFIATSESSIVWVIKRTDSIQIFDVVLKLVTYLFDFTQCYQ